MSVVVTGAEIERSASVSPVPTDVQVAKVAGSKTPERCLYSFG